MIVMLEKYLEIRKKQKHVSKIFFVQLEHGSTYSGITFQTSYVSKICTKIGKEPYHN